MANNQREWTGQGSSGSYYSSCAGGVQAGQYNAYNATYASNNQSEAQSPPYQPAQTQKQSQGGYQPSQYVHQSPYPPDHDPFKQDYTGQPTYSQWAPPAQGASQGLQPYQSDPFRHSHSPAIKQETEYQESQSPYQQQASPWQPPHQGGNQQFQGYDPSQRYYSQPAGQPGYNSYGQSWPSQSPYGQTSAHAQYQGSFPGTQQVQSVEQVHVKMEYHETQMVQQTQQAQSAYEQTQGEYGQSGSKRTGIAAKMNAANAASYGGGSSVNHYGSTARDLN